MEVKFHQFDLKIRKKYRAELILYFDDTETIKYAFIHDKLAEPVRGTVRLYFDSFEVESDKELSPRDQILLFKVLREAFVNE